ncbi:MAG: twin-arginine translocase TatA/TatE family subunit [Streptosporangiales bacterium]|nr:twin-arginine translocase TatA/TatE family subunit [Streptosporangiales bacterium]
MPNIGAPELIIIAVALVVLFGATKLPTFARSVGRSMRIFKSEVKGMQDDDATEEKDKDAKPAESPQQLSETKPGDEWRPGQSSESGQTQRAAEQR